MSWTEALKEYAKKNGKWVVPAKNSSEYADVIRIQKALKGEKEAPKVEAPVEKPKKVKKVVKEKVVETPVEKPKGDAKVLRERQAKADKIATEREATRKMRIDLLEKQLAEEKAREAEEEKKPKKSKKVVEAPKPEPPTAPPTAVAPPASKRKGRKSEVPMKVENKDITLSFN